MTIGEFFATFGGGVFVLVVIVIVVASKIGKNQSEKNKERDKQQAERYNERNAETDTIYTSIRDEQRRRQEELKRRLQQKYGQAEQKRQDDEQAAKHAKHVEDSHAHAHLGEEEHYEEIVGSLGEINDEGCQDLSGVRFIATDIAYEADSLEQVDYNRLANALVLGEIVNSPRFKAPYSRRK